MPVFEFVCDRCSNDETERVYEVFTEMDGIVECPDCHEPLRKIMSAPAFIIK